MPQSLQLLMISLLAIHLDRLYLDSILLFCARAVTRSLNKSDAVIDLALIQTSLLSLCKSCCCDVIYVRKAVKFALKQGQHQPRFYSKA